jgi:tetratricopeptide (TPR) repeat protein
MNPQFSHALLQAPSRRRLLAILAASILAASGLSALPVHAAAPADEAVVELQHEWEVIRYQSPPAEREKLFEALATKAHKVSETHPGQAGPLIWEGIVVSSWAGEKGGLGALGLVKQAKALYESAIAIDGDALEGSAYNSLGVLYYKVPGWPVGFGDKAKAKELLQKALALNPKGIDPNYFYGEYLVETKQADQAATYLTRAIQAPPRPGRQVADTGRREEARILLDKVKAR